MDGLMQLWDRFWNGFLGIPLGYLSAWFNLDTVTAWKAAGWRLFFLAAILFIIYEILINFRLFVRNFIKRDNRLTPEAMAITRMDDDAFQQSLRAVKNPELTLTALRRAKQYGRMGEVLSAINKPKEAAKWFKKAGDLKRAAAELAKAGKTVQAAKLLQKAGEHGTAARFWEEKGKYRQAAQSYMQHGDLPRAGAAFAKAGRMTDAVNTFKQYFATAKDAPEKQSEAAALCFDMLQQAGDKVAAEDRKELLLGIAQRFEAGGKVEVAANIFRECGDLVRAGRLYLKAGKLEIAAQCMKQAGNEKEAAEIGGRYYESIGRWKEAGFAYEGAGEWRRAGDCFAKVNEPLKAAECYAKAGEHFGAGFALVHAKEYEKAIPQLQKVKEDHPRYAESRALLGRCFYEMRDYEHCIATLDNYLTGARVDSKNIDYFNMLALAYEQIGDLGRSKSVLLKIRSVDVGYRDVSARLSNIESRISMGPAPDSAMRGATPVGGSGRGPNQAVINMVEKQLGERYKIEAELGRGGMGVVYKARDTQLDRPVALKFLGSLVDGNDEYKARFLREAQAAARVQHPNIISIYDIGADDGRAYIAMEYVEGPNLHKYLSRKGKLEPREAVNIIGQACLALDAVHAAGIVHRDIKPDNILIAKGGLVKLMDFGLAKGAGARLTASNVVMGTPCYMAPEQAMGREADARSDIYALGLVLHELLTGVTVFADGDVLRRQVTEMPPPPSKSVEGIPELLDQIVMKCIQKKPEERFQTVKELLGYLRQVGK